MTFNGASSQSTSPRGFERGWVRDPDGGGGLSRYIAIARDHWRLMLVLIGFVVGAAILAVTLSSKSYEAEALLSVSPVSSNDTRFDGISVIRETSVPGRDVETLARIVKTIPVAQAAANTEGVSGSPQGLLARVVVSPIGGSFLVSVSATAGTADEAAAIANAFATSAVAVRSAQFREQVENQIDAVSGQLENGVDLPEAARAQLNERLAQLQALRGTRDPSVQLGSSATPPDSPSSPALKLVIAIALVVGSIVAFGGAVAVDTASSRVRTEGQLTERFNLPILARVPKSRTGAAVATTDSYRDLAQSIAVLRRDPHRLSSVLFTSAGDGESRTASAIETARTLSDAGQRVLLVDADLRQPSIAQALGLKPTHGTGSVMLGRVPLEEAMIDAPSVRGTLKVLCGSDTDSAAAVVAISPAIIGQLLDAAATWADFIVFDAAPLGIVGDALPIATSVDDVILVVGRGETELASLGRLSDLLMRYEIVPRGLCLVGWDRSTRSREVSAPTTGPRATAARAAARRSPRDPGADPGKAPPKTSRSR